MIATNTNSANVTVIVATYNRPEALRLVLQALVNQTILPSHVIVADDGSTDDTKEVIQSFQGAPFELRHCWQEDKGFRKSAVLNRAIAHVTTPIVIFLDGDCIPLRDFVRDHLRLQQDRCVVAGPRVLLDQALTNRVENKGEPYPLSLAAALRLWLLGRLNRVTPFISLPDGTWRTRRPTKWELLRGCNFSMATRDLRRIEGFDETYEGWGLEDSDLAIRLINSGISIKSGRFGCAVLHLWHRDEKRDRLKINEETLNHTRTSGRIKAQKSYLSTYA